MKKVLTDKSYRMVDKITLLFCLFKIRLRGKNKSIKKVKFGDGYAWVGKDEHGWFANDEKWQVELGIRSPALYWRGIGSKASERAYETGILERDW